MIALPVDRLGSRFNGFIVLTWLRWHSSSEFLNDQSKNDIWLGSNRRYSNRKHMVEEYCCLPHNKIQTTYTCLSMANSVATSAAPNSGL